MQAFYEDAWKKVDEDHSCITCGREVDVEELDQVEKYVSTQLQHAGAANE